MTTPKLSKAQIRQLTLLSEHDLNVKRVIANAPAKHVMMSKLETLGLTCRFTTKFGNNVRAEYWGITDAGREVLATLTAKGRQAVRS